MGDYGDEADWSVPGDIATGSLGSMASAGKGGKISQLHTVNGIEDSVTQRDSHMEVSGSENDLAKSFKSLKVRDTDHNIDNMCACLGRIISPASSS